ncbi:hypothetical protein M2152_000322 [Microbacteriaceae bacterium SG_E_30_P1]|uniref:LytR/CpsA/Psr regulator C-terminal domain-containing protein n=1 Tax=Antiquaquibacter oligotrophicus TaxID=2880260 RepID=A0ABT6KJN4_9MICO|nr:LytR C-terminal domain-containing protein [Antiquaquibacter oligotrophicus]MDH6180140.1 hypothetical protein [Antiquaquibacter oligotrophicus]UDF14108.1 LytR C-terminal domain-containing protein [Antiquaquibacter oligotrophicus]
MASFPPDRFDNVPADLSRVGAHRAPARRGRGWIAFAWAALATGVLVFGGLFGISRFLDIDLGLGLAPVAETPTPTPTPTPTMDAVTDPSAIDPARGFTITVLNGTNEVGLQNTIGDQLAAAGWPIGTRANAQAADVVDETIVYYRIPEDEGIARGLVAALGVGDVRLVPPETFPGADITIVLGADDEQPVAEG